MAAFASSDVAVAVNREDINYEGRTKRVICTITFGDGALTYPTGGIPMPGFASFGLVRNITDIHITGNNARTTDYVYRYDRTNNKLLLYEEEAAAAGGPLLECDTSEAPAARTLNAEVVGW